MRTVIFVSLACLGILVVAAPTAVQAAPAALAVHASKGKTAGASGLDAADLIEVKGRKRAYRRARRSVRPHAYWWTRPYYRPYQYYYWQHYYPYGGPLFY